MYAEFEAQTDEYIILANTKQGVKWAIAQMGFDILNDAKIHYKMKSFIKEIENSPLPLPPEKYYADNVPWYIIRKFRGDKKGLMLFDAIYTRKHLPGIGPTYYHECNLCGETFKAHEYNKVRKHKCWKD